MIHETTLFLKSVHSIDSYYDSGADPGIRSQRASESLIFLKSGIVPKSLIPHEQPLTQFHRIYNQLDENVKEEFERILTSLFQVTETIRTINDPFVYTRLARAEANITATLMYMFLQNSQQLGGFSHTFLQFAGRVVNRVDNVLDLKKDSKSGVTQVPPTLANTLIILFT